MMKDPTIPCPVCAAPIFVRSVQLPTGDIVRFYTDPLSGNEEIVFHRHQQGDTDRKQLH